MSKAEEYSWPRSTVEKLMAQAALEEKRVEMTKEQIEQLKGAINRIFSSGDGKFFFKFLRKALRVDVIDKDYNPMTLAGDKAMRNVYLSIWTLLDADVRQQLEGGQ